MSKQLVEIAGSRWLVEFEKGELSVKSLGLYERNGGFFVAPVHLYHATCSVYTYGMLRMLTRLGISFFVYPAQPEVIKSRVTLRPAICAITEEDARIYHLAYTFVYELAKWLDVPYQKVVDEFAGDKESSRRYYGDDAVHFAGTSVSVYQESPILRARRLVAEFKRSTNLDSGLPGQIARYLNNGVESDSAWTRLQELAQRKLDDNHRHTLRSLTRDVPVDGVGVFASFRGDK